VKNGTAWQRWPHNLKVLMTAAFFVSLCVTSFSRFIPAYLRDAGIDVIWIGLFFSLSSTMSAVMAPVGGILSDIWGRRALLVLGRALSLTGWSIVILTPGTTGLLLGGIVAGFGSLAASGYRAMIAESAPEGNRATAYAVTGALENTAAVIAPMAVGFLSDRFGLRAVLSAALIPYFIGLLVSTRTRETLTRHQHDSSPSIWAGFRYLTSVDGRGALMMAMVWAVTGCTVGLSTPVLTLYMKDTFGVSYALLGLMNATISAGNVIGQLTGGRAADRFGYWRLMVTSLSITIAMWLVIPLAPTALLYTIAAAASNAAGWLAAPAWEAVGAEACERNVRGAISGIYSGGFSIGHALGSLVFGVFYSMGKSLPFYFLCATDSITLVLIIIGVRAGLKGFRRMTGSGIVEP
jgi:MFS family permease